MAKEMVRGQYPVYCSWCEKKGIKTVVNWIEVPGSSGICRACHEQMMQQLAAIRGASQMSEDRNQRSEIGRR